MIRAHIQATNLADFYVNLVAAQTGAHGDAYCAHHYPIFAWADGSATYAELGVNQGATLAAALLAGYRRVIGVDRCLEPYRVYARLFDEYVARTGQELIMLEQDSRVSVGPVDFLFIDSDHRPDHLRQELAVHEPAVRRYILGHDTAAHVALHHELTSLAGWSVVDQERSNVGYTLMGRAV